MKKLVLKSAFLFVILLAGSLNNVKAFTAVTSGAWSSAATWGGVGPGANVSGQDIIIPAGINVTLDMNVTFSGLINSFSVDGNLASSAAYDLTITQGSLTGTGLINLDILTFGFLGSSSFSGTLTLQSLNNSGTILAFAADCTIEDTLNLEAGTITLDAGANMEILANGVIRRNAGSITIGSGIFNNSNNYDVLYVGSSKVSGIELNSMAVHNVLLQLNDNSQTVTLGTDLIVNNSLNLSTGRLDLNGNDLTLYYNLVMQPGTLLQSSPGSNIIVETGLTISSGFTFASGSSVNTMTIDYTGAAFIGLESELTILNELHLINGSFTVNSGADLILNSGALVHIDDAELLLNGGVLTATAPYDVLFSGGTHTTGLEVTGSGLNDVTVDLNSASDEVHFGSHVEMDGHLNLVTGLFNFAGYNLTLNGTLDQHANGTFKGETGSELFLNINCASNDTIWFAPSFQSLEQLTINTTGPGDVVLKSQLNIIEELELSAGRINLSGHDLVIENGAVISDYSDVSYVNTSGSGSLHQYITTGAGYKVFPVGSSNSYSPCSIQQATGGSAGMFNVNVFDGVYTGGTTGTNLVTAGESLVDRTWRVESATGLTYNTNLKLGWQLSSEENGFDRTNCYISHYAPGWDNYTAGAAITGIDNTYEIERTGLTSLSPFAVSDANSELSIDQLNTFNAVTLYPNPTDGLITVNPSGNVNDYTYAVVDMAGRTLNTAVTGSNQLDVSELTSGTYVLVLTHNISGEISRTPFVKK